MQLVVVVVSWVSAVVLLLMPVELQLHEGGATPCGKAGPALVRGVLATGLSYEDAVADRCIRPALPYVGAAAALAVGGPVVAAAIGARRRRARRDDKGAGPVELL